MRSLELDLAPGAFHIFTSTDFSGLVTSSESREILQVKDQFKLYPNYPNHLTQVLRFHSV